MDMDFYSDPLFSDLGRSDFIGGIDNEALDFGNLDQFIQVSAAVGHIDNSHDNTTIGNCNNTNNNSNHNENIIVCDPKTEAPTTPPSTLNDTNLSISTLSARVSLTSTPIALANAIVNQNITHLPESPPDSGSEPPYSPLQDVHGLTLTSREIYNGPTSMHQPTTLHELQMQTPFAPPHQHSQHHFLHQQNHLNTPTAPTAPPLEIATNIRVKHEAGLIINPNNLLQQLPSNNNSSNNQLMCPNTNANNMIHYDAMNSNYYQNIGNTNGNIDAQIPTTCMLTTTSTGAMGEVSRVQLIGTSQATHTPRSSAPSTPVHLSSSRKRKMSTQIDCSDYANIKPDPGVPISPIGTMNCNSTHMALSNETPKLGPTSPVSIHLPAHNTDVSSTPAHSAASLSPALSTVNSNPDSSLDGSKGAANSSGAENGDANALTPCIRFSPFQPQNWHQLCDQSLQDISVVYYRVDADKGFNFSVSDDAFVCQKKNHFQITCHARLQGEAKFVKTPSGLEKIKSFHLHFYGVKLEAPNQTIRVEQSQSDRSKKPFYPVPIDLQSHIVSKITVGRLHFSETTNNNMRKKGRPNPEQRYFQLIVGLHVHTTSGNFPIVSQGSERIIVRASNPGQFESDVDLCWQRGLTQDSIFHAGRVGINTDRPDESLVVHGNLKVSGHIVQPSDSRAKQEIGELDTSVQLRNLQKIRIVRYRYEPEFAVHSGLRRASGSDSEEIVDTGVIAQEVREVIPDAVQEAGSIVLPNGNVIENFLLVNKDRILMENIGAVKELCKVTGSLETRIEHLERINNRLIRAKDVEKNTIQHQIRQTGKGNSPDNYEICSNRTLQIIIFFLVIVMAACLAAVSTLYFMEHNKQHHNKKQLEHLQLFDNGYTYGHDPALLNDQERSWMHLHNLLKTNKTYPHWTNFLFGSSTTLRPPADSNNTRSSMRQELIYNDSGEIYTTAHGRNDELAVVMEKPLVNLQPLQVLKEALRITTTAPLLRSNKTINSKNKSKWPLPQVVLRAATTTQQPIAKIANPSSLLQYGVGTNINLSPVISNSGGILEIKEKLNVSESTSEKVADSIPLPQDFENNSIDIDAQHQQIVTKKLAQNKLSNAHLISSINDAAAHESTLVIEKDNSDIALKLNERIGAQTIASTSSSNSINVADTTGAASDDKLNADAVRNAAQSIYKNVSPTTLVGTNAQNNISYYSIEALPISNKSIESKIENTDGIDLQSLTSNNDSADNPIAALFSYDFSGARESSLGRRSLSTSEQNFDSIIRKTVQLETFGAPTQCTHNMQSDEVSNCQSVCFEDTNQIPALLAAHSLVVPSDQASREQTNEPLQQTDVINDAIDLINNAQNHEPVAEEAESLYHDAAVATNSTDIVAGKSSHSTQAIAKQISVEQSSEDTEEVDTALTAHATQSVENLDLQSGENMNDTQNLSLKLEAQYATTSDCWQIYGFLLADNLNKTTGLEEFCTSTHKSLNVTYVLPLSKFFKEPLLELQLSSSTPLLWTICNNHEHTKRDGKHYINSPAHLEQQNTKTLQRVENSSTLPIYVRSRGYFVRDISLRATNDFKRVDICKESALETKTILQYNFRIVRDCD